MRRLSEAFRKVAEIMGAAGFYATLASGSRVLLGPLVVIFSTYYLTAEKQGFYYIFLSLAASQYLLEAGVGFCLLRFLARQKVSLAQSVPADGDVLGYTTMAFFWYGVGGLVFFLAVYLGGMAYLSHGSYDSLDWEAAFLVFCFCSALSYVNAGFLVFFEGTGHVSNVYQCRLVCSVLTPLCTIAGLACGAELHSLSIGLAAPLLYSVLFFRGRYLDILRLFSWQEARLVNAKLFLKENYKVSLVWGSGYAFWNILPLVIFSFFGAESAAAFGVSNGLEMAFVQLCIQLIKANHYDLAVLMTDGGHAEANRRFTRLASLGSVVYVSLVSGLFLARAAFPDIEIFKRLLPGGDLLMLFSIGFTLFFVSSLGDFLRLQGGDPFFRLSLFANFVIPVVVYLVARQGGSISGVIFSFLACQICMSVMAVIIYTREIRGVAVRRA